VLTVAPLGLPSARLLSRVAVTAASARVVAGLVLGLTAGWEAGATLSSLVQETASAARRVKDPMRVRKYFTRNDGKG
jgi:hypothetical protein